MPQIESQLTRDTMTGWDKLLPVIRLKQMANGLGFAGLGVDAFGVVDFGA